MHNLKRIWKRAMAACLAVSMLGTGNVGFAVERTAELQVQKKLDKAKAEAALRQAIRDSDEMEAQYPNGIFNFLGTQMEVSEDNDCLEIDIIRQGGTKGRAQVRFKAIDITSSYGDDYIIYTDKKLKNAIEKNSDSFPLIETAYSGTLNLSAGTASQDTEALVQATADSYAKSVRREADANNGIDNLKDADKADIVSNSGVINLSNNAGSALKTAKEQYTGTESDRADWQSVTDSQKEKEVRENLELFLGSVDGTETTLTFEDGEYIKTLYLVPRDDRAAEAEEQLICALLQTGDENAAPVGGSYHAYVNMIDNEQTEESVYSFESSEVKAKKHAAEITVTRTEGTGYYDIIYIGTGAGTAVADIDYTAGLQAVDFYAGQKQQTVTVEILENEYRTQDRDFYILLSKDGETYEDAGCHVIIPANGFFKAKASVANTASAEKISANGFYTGTEGQWGIPVSDMTLSDSKAVKKSGTNEVRFTFTGGTYTAYVQNVKLYGVKGLEFGMTNASSGRDWQTQDYYYKNTWHKIIRKKTWYSVSHHEDNLDTRFLIGNTGTDWANESRYYLSGSSKNWRVGKFDIDRKSDWSAKKFGYRAWAAAGNGYDLTGGWLRLYLKKYGISINNSQTYVVDTYTIGSDDSLSKDTKKSKKLTAQMTLASITSNVGNSRDNIYAESYSTAYRSDALNFYVNYDANSLSFQGIEVSVDNKNWKLYTKGSSSIVLNQAFFEKFDCWSNSTLYFRPKFEYRSAQVVLKADDIKRGDFSSPAKTRSYSNLHVGDTITQIAGLGTMAAYNPTFSVAYGAKKNPSNFVVTGANNCGLTKYIDTNKKESEHEVNLTLKDTYTILKLSYGDPELIVQADPNMYKNSYTNLTYTFGGNSYNTQKDTQWTEWKQQEKQTILWSLLTNKKRYCYVPVVHTVKASETLQKMQETFASEYYGKNRDTSVTISFDYQCGGKTDLTDKELDENFQEPQSAILRIYDSIGTELKSYTIKPTVKTTRGASTYHFSLTRNWKQEGWNEGTYATIQILSSVTVTDQHGVTSRLTTLETPVDFLGNTGAYVTVGTDGSSSLEVSSLKDKVSIAANPFSTYQMNAYTNAGFIARWGDYSLDTNGDGNISPEEIEEGRAKIQALGFTTADVINDPTIYYGNIYTYQPNYFNQSKIYYDFVKRNTISANNMVSVKLTKKTSTVLRPTSYKKEPLTDAVVTFAGTAQAKGDSKGYYRASGAYEKGLSYLATVNLGCVNFVTSVIGTQSTSAEIDYTKYQFPTDFTVTIQDEDGKEKEQNFTYTTLLDICNADTTFSFTFKSLVGVTADMAKIRIYDENKKLFHTETLTRANAKEKFKWTANLMKMGVQPGFTMGIQGIYTYSYTDTEDGEKKSVQYEYPEIMTGITFHQELTALSIAASFKTPFAAKLKMFGDICTEFDLPLDYNLKELANVTPYTATSATGNEVSITTYQIAFGYNNKVMEKLKQQQVDARVNDGETMSGRDNIKKYMADLFDDDKDDDKDDKEDKTDSKETKENKDKADEQQKDAPDTGNSSMGNGSFDFDFSVAVILTIETGINSDGTDSDGHNYFDSLMLIASGTAKAEYSVVYTTPIGIDIIAEMSAGGNAMAAFGLEASNGYKQDDVFNLSKNGADKTGMTYTADKFSMYTKFLLAPTITIGAGVGVGSGAISVTVSGTADFAFGFTAPIMGNNETSSGYGTVTLSAALKLKILFIKKTWTLYKSEPMNLFSYGKAKIASLMEDFDENYLYEELENGEGMETISRDYLENQSRWMPKLAKAKAAVSQGEKILQENVYPYPETDIVDLGDGRLLSVYIADANNTAITFEKDSEDGKKEAGRRRNAYSRAVAVYIYSEDNGRTWTKPCALEGDGTWDESPKAFVVKDGKVLVVWSDAAKIYTEEDAVTNLSLLDITGAWLNTESGTPQIMDVFNITTTDDSVGEYDLGDGETEYQYMEYTADTAPMISYDEGTARLIIYYTKTEYAQAPQPTVDGTRNAGAALTGISLDKEAKDDAVAEEEAVLYGDVINAYNVIAYRYAEEDADGNFIWNTTYDPDENLDSDRWYGQRFLDLAVPAVIQETVGQKESMIYVCDMDENGNLVQSQVPTTEEVMIRELTADKSTDPRVIDSDCISYNGLALYAYVSDFDQDLQTLDDQQVYVQIYNYEDNEFHYPIQITGDRRGNTNPRFVRCQDVTYLYWLSGGDVQYINITELLTAFGENQESSNLELKTIQTENGSANLYLLDRSGADPVATAVKHKTTTAADGTVYEDVISEFEIKANDNTMYLLWTAMATSLVDEEETGVQNVIRETQVFGAYCEPAMKVIREAQTFEDTEELKYTFVEGKDNTTYPVSATTIKSIDSEDGQTSIATGAVIRYYYNQAELDAAQQAGEDITDAEITEDVNGQTGVVAAGDKAWKKLLQSTQGTGWSVPVQITQETGANYTDLSFRVTEEGWIQAVYVRGTQTLDEDQIFHEDENTKKLCVQTFEVESRIVTGELETDKEQYEAGDTVVIGLDICNDGLKPLEDVTYRYYAEKNGEILDETVSEWKAADTVLLSAVTNTMETETDADGHVTRREDIVETTDKNVLIGGKTVNITGSAIALGENTPEGISIVVEIRHGNDVKTVKKELAYAENLGIVVESAELIDENTAELVYYVANTGNKDYTGTVAVHYNEKTLETENITIPYGENILMTQTVDISDCRYGDLVTNEDGSKQDSFTLEVLCGNAAQEAQIVRATTAEAGYASDAVTDFGIGYADMNDRDTVTGVKKNGMTTDTDSIYMMKGIFTVDETSDAAKHLAEQGLAVDSMMTTVWESSDNSVAYVDANGTLVPMKEGNVTLTAKAYPTTGMKVAAGSAPAAVSDIETLQESGDLIPEEEFKADGTDFDEIYEMDENDLEFGFLTGEAQTGIYTNEKRLYEVPSSLVRKAAITVTVKDPKDHNSSGSSGNTGGQISVGTGGTESSKPSEDDNAGNGQTDTDDTDSTDHTGNDNSAGENPGDNGINQDQENKKSVNGRAVVSIGTVKTKKDGTAALISYKKTAKKQITLPSRVTVNGVSYTLTEIREKAFAKAPGTVVITLPKTIVKIGKNAFKGAKKLEKLIIKSNKKLTFKKRAFYASAIKIIVLKNKVRLKMEAQVFKGSRVTKLVLKGSSVLTIARNAWKGFNTKKLTVKADSHMSAGNVKKLKKQLNKTGFAGVLKTANTKTP